MNLSSCFQKSVLFILCFFYLGCQRIGPHYATPQLDLPTEWQIPKEMGEIKRPVEETYLLENRDKWWLAFQDLELNHLMEKALENNLDIQVAYHRVQEYHALFLKSEADLYPQLNMGIGRRNADLPKSGIFFQQPGLLKALEAQNAKVNRHYHFYHIGPSFSWEIDLFGRLQSENLARSADWDSLEEYFAGAQLSLTAEVVNNYIALKSVQNQLSIQEGYQANLEKRLNVLKDRLLLNKAALDHVSDVDRKLSEVNQTLSQLNYYLEKYKHRLLTLIGKSTETCGEALMNVSSVPKFSLNIQVGIPSDLLQQRPDVRQADHEFAAATYRIGSSMASALPRFDFSTVFGGISNYLANIYSVDNLYLLYEPFLSIPFYDAGRNKAEVRRYKAKANQAFFHYQKTLLNAFEEAQLALYSLNHEQISFAEKKQIETHVVTSKERNQLLYQQGMADYLSFSNAEDQFYQQKMEIVRGEESLALSFVNVCKAFGGHVY